VRTRLTVPAFIHYFDKYLGGNSLIRVGTGRYHGGAISACGHGERCFIELDRHE
jgi:hypothetical protein